MRIISGAQTGVDLASLQAASRLGFKTGGWMPKGFINHTGQHPEYAVLYGVQEHKSDRYPGRTFANVKDAQVTILIAQNWNSAGEALTLKAIEQYKSPTYQISRYAMSHDAIVLELVGFILKGNYRCVNFAGNSERTSPGIQKAAYKFLKKVFGCIKAIRGTD